MLPDLDHLREIVTGLRQNPVRTLLTAFGVFWGLFLLILLLGSGNGLENGANRGFGEGATNSFFVWAQRTSKPHRGLKPGRALQLTDEDTKAIRAAIPDAGVIAPTNQLGGYGGGNNVTRGTKSGGFNVVGAHPELRAIELMRLTRGRFLNPLDLAEQRKIAVIGPRVQEVLFGRDDDPIGKDIRIQGVSFQVVGVFRTAQSGEDAERKSQTIYVPFNTFQRAFHQGNHVGWFAVTARPGVAASAVETQVLELLRSRHQVAPDDTRAFGHWNTEEEYNRLMGLFAGIRTLVWIVGIGTLSAGVIGVSNIMLVIVKERTREIGIRRAVGATPLWITSEIVVESLLLTAVAGYLGLLAGMTTLDLVRGLLAGSASSNVMFANPEVGIESALQALGVLVVAGILAGLLPAQRALAIGTVDALRTE